MLPTSVYEAPFWIWDGNTGSMILRTELGSMEGRAPGCITLEKMLRSRAVVGAVSNCVVTSYLWTYVLFSRLLPSMTPYPRRIPPSKDKRISTGNKRARRTETIMALHNRYPSFRMMMLPEWHIRAFHTNFLIAVCVRLTNLWRTCYAGILTSARCFLLKFLCSCLKNYQGWSVLYTRVIMLSYEWSVN